MEPRVNTIEQLFSVFRGSPDPVLLLGGGASIKSGIPLGDDLVEKAVRWEYCRSRSFDYEDIRVKRSDWLAWLKEHPWYIPASLADNYPLVTKHLLQPKHNRKQFFLSVLNPSWVLAGGEPGNFILTSVPRLKDPSELQRMSEHEQRAEATAHIIAQMVVAPTIAIKSSIPTITVSNVPAEADDEDDDFLTEMDRAESVEMEEELAQIAEEQSSMKEQPAEGGQ